MNVHFYRLRPLSGSLCLSEERAQVLDTGTFRIARTFLESEEICVEVYS